MPPTTTFPDSTWAISSASSAVGSVGNPSGAATSGDHARRRGADTGVGRTGDHAAPGTWRGKISVRWSPGSDRTTRSSQLSASNSGADWMAVSVWSSVIPPV